MKKMPVVSKFVLMSCAGVLFATAVTYGAEIRVMTSGAFMAAYLDLKSQFEQATQDTVVTVTTTMGTGPNSIPNRLRRGESADVVIVDDAALDRLIADGRVVARSKVQLGRSSIGMAVRSGTAKPDIRSIDALKQTLLQAKSIAYSASVSGEYLSTELFPRLGIAAQLAPKSQRIEGERVGAVVARGEAEIGFQQVSELLPIRGIDYVGPLPSEAQRITVFSGGVGAGSKNTESASRFIRFLASSDAAQTIARSGLEPIAGMEPPRAFHLLEGTIGDIHEALRSARTTCRELVEHYLNRVAAYNKAGPALNAVAAINPRALEEAERLDAAFRESGPVGGLHCIPVLVKDQLETKRHADRWLGEAYLLKGMYEEAACAFSKIEAPIIAAGFLGYCHARTGREHEAREILRKLEATGTPPPADQIAVLHLGLGDTDAALQWLGKAAAERSMGIHWLKVEPVWDPLRPDPRFAAVLREMRLHD